MSEQEIAHFELLLFSVDPQMVESAVAAGVDGIIVDWENQEKKVAEAKEEVLRINHLSTSLKSKSQNLNHLCFGLLVDCC